MPGKKIYTNDDTVFNYDTEQSFYWAGFTAADGCIMEKRMAYPFVFKVSLAIKDINHLKKLKLFLRATNPVKTHTRKKDNTTYCELAIYSKDLCSSLFRFGITPRKSLTYIIPEDIVNHSLFKHFVRGYMDGDGSLAEGGVINNKSAQYGVGFRGTSKCLTSINESIIRDCDIGDARKIYNSDSIGSLIFCGNQITEKVCNYIYNDDAAIIYLDRKYEVYQSLLLHNIKIQNYLVNKFPSFSLSKEQVEASIKRHQFAKDSAEELNIGWETLSRLVIKYNLRHLLKRTQKRKTL